MLYKSRSVAVLLMPMDTHITGNLVKVHLEQEELVGAEVPVFLSSTPWYEAAGV